MKNETNVRFDGEGLKRVIYDQGTNLVNSFLENVREAAGNIMKDATERFFDSLINKFNSKR